MSDSDSDDTFESADEGEDFEPLQSTKCENISNISNLSSGKEVSSDENKKVDSNSDVIETDKEIAHNKKENTLKESAQKENVVDEKCGISEEIQKEVKESVSSEVITSIDETSKNFPSEEQVLDSDSSEESLSEDIRTETPELLTSQKETCNKDEDHSLPISQNSSPAIENPCSISNKQSEDTNDEKENNSNFPLDDDDKCSKISDDKNKSKIASFENKTSEKENITEAKNVEDDEFFNEMLDTSENSKRCNKENRKIENKDNKMSPPLKVEEVEKIEIDRNSMDSLEASNKSDERQKCKEEISCVKDDNVEILDPDAIGDATGWDVGWDIEDEELDLDLESENVNSQNRVETSEYNSKKSSYQPAASSDKVSNSKKTSDWGWGGWGSSLISTASASVSTFTDQVGQGLGTVLESVESKLGAPSPEELAKAAPKCADNSPTDPDELESKPDDSAFKFGNLFSGVSNIIESTSSKVIEGSVGALESIGKKTIDILTEGDPGLKKKRSMLSGNTPVLSQALRQAKKQYEESEIYEQKTSSQTPVSFPSLFDKHNGLIHLEALEMLSDQSKVRVESQSVMSSCSEDMIELFSKIEEICSDLPDADEDEDLGDFSEIISSHYECLKIQLSPTKFINIISDINKDLETEESRSVLKWYESAIVAQAILTSRTIEQLHKMSELLLLGSSTDTLSQTNSIIEMTVRICGEIESISTKYAEKLLNNEENNEKVNDFTTNIYFEMSNSNTYIHDAVKLMSPILQLSAVMKM